jgi:putative IMPACT (imprinted ancient) family translation regulator
VTRYFGGTKLGTGGLARAYGDAVRHVLSVLPRAIKVPIYTVGLETPYSLYERVLRLVRAHRGQVLDQTFAGQVMLVFRLPQDRLAGMQRALGELSRGQIRANQLGNSESTILPLESATQYRLD